MYKFEFIFFSKLYISLSRVWGKLKKKTKKDKDKKMYFLKPKLIHAHHCYL